MPWSAACWAHGTARFACWVDEECYGGLVCRCSGGGCRALTLPHVTVQLYCMCSAAAGHTWAPVQPWPAQAGTSAKSRASSQVPGSCCWSFGHKDFHADVERAVLQARQASSRPVLQPIARQHHITPGPAAAAADSVRQTAPLPSLAPQVARLQCHTLSMQDAKLLQLLSHTYQQHWSRTHQQPGLHKWPTASCRRRLHPVAQLMWLRPAGQQQPDIAHLLQCVLSYQPRLCSQPCLQCLRSRTLCPSAGASIADGVSDRVCALQSVARQESIRRYCRRSSQGASPLQSIPLPAVAEQVGSTAVQKCAGCLLVHAVNYHDRLVPAQQGGGLVPGVLVSLRGCLCSPSGRNSAACCLA